MLLNSWFPLNDMSRTLREVDRVFNLVNHTVGMDSVSHRAFPVINMYDQEGSTTLLVEVPGVTPDQLELTVLDDSLTLKGERPAVYQDGERPVRCERPHGSFSRTITLPDTVDPESIQADYQNGVLKVTMKKADAVQPKRIEIQS